MRALILAAAAALTIMSVCSASTSIAGGAPHCATGGACQVVGSFTRGGASLRRERASFTQCGQSDCYSACQIIKQQCLRTGLIDPSDCQGNQACISAVYKSQLECANAFNRCVVSCPKQ